jgi:hypothetical protein
MDDQDSSSSALMIGLIVGGGVILALVLFAVLGAGIWFLAPGPVAPPVAAPAPVMVVEEGPAPPPPVPMAVAEPKVEAQPQTPQRKIIGVWNLMDKKEETATWDFHEDGTLLLTAERPGKGKLETKGRWEVQAAKEGPGLKLIRTAEKGPRAENDIRFLDDDTFVIEGPGGGATYRRRGK